VTEGDGLIWVQGPGTRPICDVPWLGNTIVLSNGAVHFCCFSDAVVGNVNVSSFGEIWNGEKMKGIRRALTEQRLPAECRSPSCPFFRGDEFHYLIDRNRKEPEVPQTHHLAEALSGSDLEIDENSLRLAGPLEVRVNLRFAGKSAKADLFVGVKQPDGLIRFLPGCDAYAVPCRTDIRLDADADLSLVVRDQTQSCLAMPGKYLVCAALFESGSDPNRASNCYWSKVAPIEIR
jgi:hypothetical protein